jgi:hypothetical protein
MTVAIDDSSNETKPQCKETAGAKVKKFLDKQDGYLYEAGEVLEGVFKDLEKTILDIRKQNILLPEYYIVTQTDKIPWLGDALHLRTWWRKTRPTPQAKQDCYKVTNPGDIMVAQWSIPFPQNCQAICANPKAYDPQLARWVIDFIKGTLK